VTWRDVGISDAGVESHGASPSNPLQKLIVFGVAVCWRGGKLVTSRAPMECTRHSVFEDA